MLIILALVLFGQGWLKYQVLWDLEPNDVFQRLGTDIQSWFECLKDIKYAFDRVSIGSNIAQYTKQNSHE